MRDQGKTIQASALASGISERSAYEWKSGPLPSELKKSHDWRTRKDPFAEVWEGQVVPMLQAENGHKLQAKTILKHLKWPIGEEAKGSLRTLQRRICDWKIAHGPEKEVYFRQEKTPGRCAGFDFTCCNELRITIVGRPFEHLFFEYVLLDSGWRDVTLARSETYEAMVTGLQNAFWKCEGVPSQLRHDNLSAAVREHPYGRAKLTTRFTAFIAAYGLDALPITPGKSHENGTCEQAHFRWKVALEQALIVRQNRDFPSTQAYELFCSKVLRELNDACNDAFKQERQTLAPLPAQRLPDHTEYQATVRRWSTVHFHGQTYSVPSRLIGRRVFIRQFAQSVEIWYKSCCVATLERAHGKQVKAIDYRHVVHWLVRKPGAFASYVHREELFPTLTFRRVYDKLTLQDASRADAHYLRILECAALHGEQEVEEELALLLGADQVIVSRDLAGKFAPKQSAHIEQSIHEPEFVSYDELLNLSIEEGVLRAI